ncbi:MAG: preprotein translocase subunit Sec61beta [Candidatus Micrarchaeota archaeon]
MSQEKVQAPATSAGLIRFYDVSSSNIQVDPKAIVGLCVAVIILELALHFLI